MDNRLDIQKRHMSAVRLYRHVVGDRNSDPLWACRTLPHAFEARCRGEYYRGDGKPHKGQHSYLHPVEGILFALLLVVHPPGSGRRQDVALAVKLATSLVLPRELIKSGIVASVPTTSRLVGSNGIWRPESLEPYIALDHSLADELPLGSLKQYFWFADDEHRAADFQRCLRSFASSQKKATRDYTHAALAICCSTSPHLRADARDRSDHVAVLGGACLADCVDIVRLELDLCPHFQDLTVRVVTRGLRMKASIEPALAATTSSLKCLRLLHQRHPALFHRPMASFLERNAARHAIDCGNVECLRYLLKEKLPLISVDNITAMDDTTHFPTALSMSIQRGNLPLFTFLVEEMGLTPSKALLEECPRDNPIRGRLEKALRIDQ